MKQHTFGIVHALFGILATTLALLWVSSVYAQENTTAPTTPPTPRGERMEAYAQRKEALSENVQNRIINLATNVKNRLTAATERMENIIGRLDARIKKMKDLGVETGSAEAKLTDAKSALAAAQDTLDEITSIQSAITSDTPRESFNVVRVQFIGTRDLIKQTHVLLRETVSLLKNAPLGSASVPTTDSE